MTARPIPEADGSDEAVPDSARGGEGQPGHVAEPPPALTPPSTPHSARVELELAILASEPIEPARQPSGEADPTGRNVLIVASDADLRLYVRRCLERRTDLRVREAGSAGAARQAAKRPAALLVVAEGEAAVLAHFPTTPAILLAAESSEALPGAGDHGAPLAVLVGPFPARRLADHVDFLLAWSPP